MSEDQAVVTGVRHPGSGLVHREWEPGFLFCTRGWSTRGYTRVPVDEVVPYDFCRNCWPGLYQDPPLLSPLDR